MYPSYNGSPYNGRNYNSNYYGSGGAQPAMYRGTVTGLRISAVDGGATESGGAFIDGANASITALADGNHQIEIYDSSGRKLEGVLKAAGSAETLSGSEMLTNPAFTANVNGWSARAGASIAWSDGAQKELELTITGAGGGFNQGSLSVVAGTLYKRTATGRSGTRTSGMIWNNFADDTQIGASYLPLVAEGTYTNYITAPTTTAVAVFSTSRLTANNGTMYYNSVSQQAVTAPSTSGATIVSAKGGVTYNFTSKDASFTYNEASYVVVVRRLR
jgi:hypothetical protein